MARLSFSLLRVKAEWEAAQAASQHCQPYTGRKAEAGLWLVGDHGVYLMGNDKGRLPEKDGGRPVVYARECDPTSLAFDDWWETKHRTFGGDDGVEQIPGRDVALWVASAEKHRHGSLVLEISFDNFRLLLGVGEPV